MDLSKIKLVVSDMDGTLLNSNHEVSSDFFKLYDQLSKFGIFFVAASGRPYYSITNKLEGIKDRIAIIAENGGVLSYNNEIQPSFKIPKQKLLTIEKILTPFNDIAKTYCAQDCAYIIAKDEDTVKIITEYYSQYQIINSVSVVEEPIVKVALYHSESSERFIYPFIKSLEKELRVLVSANHWVDISDPRIDKGNSLKLLQQKLNISKEETIVFGDYNNDLGMFDHAKYRVAMANAHPNVKAVANIETASNNELGVEQILKRIILSKEVS
jgi:Cof subfamily protein (haloacid dehalogenase superfamily)